MVDLIGVLSLSLGQYPPTLLSQSHQSGSSSSSRLARLEKEGMSRAVRSRLSTLPFRDLKTEDTRENDHSIALLQQLP